MTSTLLLGAPKLTLVYQNKDPLKKLAPSSRAIGHNQQNHETKNGLLDRSTSSSAFQFNLILSQYAKAALFKVRINRYRIESAPRRSILCFPF